MTLSGGLVFGCVETDCLHYFNDLYVLRYIRNLHKFHCFAPFLIHSSTNIGISYFSKFDRRCQISGVMLIFLKIRFASFQAVSKFTLTDFDKFCWRCDSAFAVQIIMRRHHFLSTWLYPKLVVFHSFAKRSIFYEHFSKMSSQHSLPSPLLFQSDECPFTRMMFFDFSVFLCDSVFSFFSDFFAFGERLF